MTYLASLSRAAALAGLLLAGAAAAAPAYAAPADVALLKSYIGEWRGRGVLEGANSESVVCRLSLSDGNQDQVVYKGRCTLAGSQLSVAGTLIYAEASKRFEAAMSSNAAFTGVAIGQKRGNNLVFDLREREKDDEGKEFSIQAQILLGSDAIQVTFDITYVESGDTMQAAVPFTR